MTEKEEMLRTRAINYLMDNDLTVGYLSHQLQLNHIYVNRWLYHAYTLPLTRAYKIDQFLTKLGY